LAAFGGYNACVSLKKLFIGLESFVLFISFRSLLLFTWGICYFLVACEDYSHLSLGMEVVVGIANIPARVTGLARSQLDDTGGAAVFAVTAVVRGQAVPPSRLAVFFGSDLGINLGGHLGSRLGDETAFRHPGLLLGRRDSGYKLGGLLGKGQAHLL
jgi:hypothetical protein